MSPEEIITMLKGMNLSKEDDEYDASLKMHTYLKSIGKSSRDFDLSGGASKLCLTERKANYVIKWTHGFTTEDEAYDEVIIYKKAINEGLERFFPQTALLCEINGVKFVAQSKIDYSVSELPHRRYQHYKDVSKTAREKLVRKMEKEFNKHCHGYERSLDLMWGKMALTLFGKRMCKHLCQFIQENGINDLHGNNIGYQNNRPVILDFSGYHRRDY